MRVFLYMWVFLYRSWTSCLCPTTPHPVLPPTIPSHWPTDTSPRPPPSRPLPNQPCSPPYSRLSVMPSPPKSTTSHPCRLCLRACPQVSASSYLVCVYNIIYCGIIIVFMGDQCSGLLLWEPLDHDVKNVCTSIWLFIIYLQIELATNKNMFLRN